MLRRLLNKLESIYKYRYFAKNEQGAYQFLVKKIYKSTDIDFIEKAWQLDHFREVITLSKVKINPNRKILVLAPHQDDELIGCGGTLQLYKKQNAEITLCFLTDGEELSNPKDSIKIRHEEAQNVANSLSASIVSIGINNLSMHIEDSYLLKLISLLNQEWDEIFTVWPLDQPPKHRLCSYFVGSALAKSTYAKNITFYAVHTDLFPNFYCDITNVIDVKQDLLKMYPSQMKAQRYDHLSLGLDAWRSRLLPVSNEARYIEIFLRLPKKAYQDFQDIYINVSPRKLFKANDVCIRSFKKIKSQYN